MLLFGRFQKVLLSSHIRVVDNDPEVHGWHGQRRQTSFSDNAPKEPYCVFEICVCRRPPLAHSLLWVYPVIMRLQLDVSAGELVDRITILELKLKLLPQMYRMELQVTLDRARHVLEQAVDFFCIEGPALSAEFRQRLSGHAFHHQQQRPCFFEMFHVCR